MEFREHTLDNGLQIIAECNDEVHTAALGFFVRTGARDESDKIAGVSHFLEHMLFKGTPSRTAEDVNREFDELGASPNAFTSQELTVYHTPYLPEYQTRILEIWADCMRPSLRTEDFDVEKKVIVEEIRMYQDQPPYGAFDEILQLHFRDHPLARSVLGTVESITDLEVADMRGYFEARYCPSNITLVGAGRIDFDSFTAAAARTCGHWEAREAPRETPPPPAYGSSRHVDVKATSTQEYLLMLSNAPAADDPRRYTAKLIGAMLGDDSGSRLYWELIDTGLAEFVSLGHEDYQGAGVFCTYAGCEPEAVSQTIEKIQAVFREVEQNGFTQEELDRAKSKATSRLVLSSERPRSRLFSVGGCWLQQGAYRTVKQEIDAFRAVTVEDANQLLREFPFTETTMLAVGPLGELP